MNHKGFVLMETIVVIVVISVALLTIFSSYIKILTKVKTENKYDTSEYVYMTNYIKEYLSTTSTCSKTIYEMGKDDGGNARTNKTLINHFNNECGFDVTNNPFNIKGIYLVKYLTEIDEDGYNDTEKFDAYMIDYIRKLDVGEEDELIIVEYKRHSMNKNYEERKLVSDYVTEAKDKLLYETYISSLEWGYEVK